MARYASVEVKVAPPTDLSLFTVRCRDDIDDINDECEPTQLQKKDLFICPTFMGVVSRA